jgi:hypothetical protein
VHAATVRQKFGNQQRTRRCLAGAGLREADDIRRGHAKSREGLRSSVSKSWSFVSTDTAECRSESFHFVLSEAKDLQLCSRGVAVRIVRRMG